MTLDPINLYDYEARAKQILPHNAWDFIEAGSMDETTTRRNRTAFESLTLRPRFLRDITERSISTTVLNQSQGGNYILERWQRHGRCKHQCVGSGL